MEISVVIPCYNSALSVKELQERLVSSLTEMKVTFEIIYVNDRSKDNTLEVLKEIASGSPQVKVIDLMFNVGQFRALYCGLEHATGEYIVTMDDDLQHPPEEIHHLYEAIIVQEEIDAIFGNPKKKRHSSHRQVGSFVIRKINENIFGKPKDLVMSAFRILRKGLVETLVSHRTMYPVFGPLILKSTNRIINLEVEHDQRKHGQSNYNLVSLIKTTFDNIINFSSLPLKYIGLVGIFTSMGGFLLAFYYLVKYFFMETDVSGWTTIVVLMNIYGGLILLSIGIIGEYLVRVLAEVQGFPKYHVRKIYKYE